MRTFLTRGRRRYALLLFIVVGSVVLMGNQCAPPTGGTFTATLDGTQVVPPVASPGSGSATVTLDATETTITVDVVFADLSGTDVSARIQGPAAPGVNGLLVILLPNFPLGVTAGTYHQQSLAITATQVSNLKAGLLYIVIGSSQFPAGEIRGQLTAVP